MRYASRRCATRRSHGGVQLSVADVDRVEAIVGAVAETLCHADEPIGARASLRALRVTPVVPRLPAVWCWVRGRRIWARFVVVEEFVRPAGRWVDGRARCSGIGAGIGSRWGCGAATRATREGHEDGKVEAAPRHAAVLLQFRSQGYVSCFRSARNWRTTRLRHRGHTDGPWRPVGAGRAARPPGACPPMVQASVLR